MKKQTAAGIDKDAAPAGAPECRLSHCCFCSMQCSLEWVPGQRPEESTVRPGQDFPVSTGKLCQKGFQSLQHVFHPSRVKEPLMRARDRGWQAVSWDTALDEIAEGIRAVQARYGKDAVCAYGGGSLTNEACYLLGKFARVALETRHVDYNGRYCMSAAAAAANRAFGIDRGMTMPLKEISDSKYIILAGTNIAECQPTLIPYLLHAKRNGAVIVTIDPRNTPTSKIADIHVRIQPGFDSVFVNGLLHVIIAQQWFDPNFVRDRTEGFEELREAVQPFTPDYVERISGVLSAVTRTVAKGFAGAVSGVVLTARGLEQQVNGVDNVLNYINLCLITGKIGRPGCGFGTVTGQANGQGGREHGQKADQLPGYRLIEDPRDREHVAAVWGIPAGALPPKGVSAWEMIRKIHAGEIKSMVVLGSNPVVSSPNASFVEQALAKLELLVVIDLFETETAEFAHWLLPGSSFLEEEGTLTNVEGRVFHRRQVLERQGNARPDREIVCALAERLGKGEYFQYASVEEVFDELKLCSRGGKADYYGISYERLRREKGVFWPCPAADHPGTPLMFAEAFHRPGGRARMFGIAPKWPAEPPDADFPYILTTGRLASHYLSGAQTRRSGELNRKAPVPIAEIHPWLAEKISLKVNSRIRITSRRGSLVVGVKVTEGIHPATLFVPFHWGKDLSVNRLTIDAVEPDAHMPEFKICAVRVERVDDGEGK